MVSSRERSRVVPNDELAPFFRARQHKNASRQSVIDVSFCSIIIFSTWSQKTCGEHGRRGRHVSPNFANPIQSCCDPLSRLLLQIGQTLHHGEGTSGGQANPTLTLHSLRHSFKDLLRDMEVSKELNDYITGHGQGDVAGEYGVGPSLAKRREIINRIPHPWLSNRPASGENAVSLQCRGQSGSAVTRERSS